MARFILTAELQLRAPTNTAAVLQTIQRQLQGLTTSVTVTVNRQSINQINSINRTIRQTRRDAGEATDAFEAFGKQAALAVRRFGAFVTATFAFRQLVTSIISGVKEAIDFERQIFKIAQVTNNAVSDIKDLSGEVTRLSTSLGVSSTKLIQSAQVLAQAGLTAKDTKIALEALAKSELSPTFEDITETTEGAIAIFQQFGKEAKDLEGILGSLNAVSGKFAVESSDLITAVRRTGGAFKAAGGNLDELSALFTSVRATTRESAESIATGFRTIFTRIQRPRTVNFLKELGIELTDLKGQFVGPLEAVRRLSIALEKIPSTDIRFAQVIEELGGFRQVSKVIPLIQQFALSEKALSVAQTGRASLTEDAAKAQGSLAVQITKVREEFAQLIRDFTNDTTFRSIVKITLEFASALIKVADAIRPLGPAIGLLGGLGGGFAVSRALGKFNPASGFLGNIFKFSSGGKVPGHGSGDTVPAMLEPGEFVLRKRAVQALGPENIAKFNKGGHVRSYAQGSPGKFTPITEAILARLGIKTDSAAFKKAGVTREQILSSDQDTVSTAIANLQGVGSTHGNKIRNAAFAKAVAKKKPKKIDNIVVGSLSEAMFGGLFLKPIQDKKVKSIGSLPFGKLSGDNQSAVARQLGVRPETLSSAKVLSKLDFGFVEGRTAKRFEISGRRVLNESVRTLLNKFSPSGSSIPNGVVSEAVKTSNLDGALGSLFEAFSVSLGNVSPVNRGKNATFDILDVGPSRQSLKPLFGEIGESVLASDLKLSATKESTASIVKKAVQYAIDTKKMSLFSKTQSKIDSELPKFHSGERLKTLTPIRRAAGGPAGKDTQPALLTPGEFVLNKDAVDRIGVPTLNKLNKVQKLNKGGVVGYAGGGFIDKATSGSGLLVGSIALQMISSLDSLGENFQKLASSVGGAVIQAGLFATVLKQSTFVTERATAAEAANLAVEKQKNVGKSLAGRASALTGRIDARRSTLNNIINSGGTISQDQLDEFNELRARRRTALRGVRASSAKQTRLEGAARTANSSLTRANVGAAALGLAAGAASVGGDFLSQRGREDIEAGGTSRTKSGIGGTLSGAAQGALIGATIGSAVPVIGTALGALAGAVVGGTIGLTSALSDASSQIADIKFGKTVEQLNIDIKRGISIGGGSNSGNINRGLNAISNRITSTTGESRVAAEGAAKNALPELQQFFDVTAKGSKSIEEFNRKIGKDTLNLFSLFSKIPLEEVNKQYKKQIESQNAAAKAQLDLTKATDLLDTRIRNAASVSRAIGDVSVSLDGFNQSLSETLTGMQDFGSLLGSQDGVADTKRFEALTRATGASFGAAGRGTASDSIAANKVLSELPAVLTSLKNIDLFSEDAAASFPDILKDRLTKATGNDPSTKGFIDLVGAKAGTIIGGEGRPQKLIEKITTDPEGTFKEFGSAITFASDVVAKEFKLVSDSGKLLSSGLEKVTRLTIESIDGFNAALDIQKDIDEFKASLVPNSRFSADATERTLRQQLANTTKSLGVSDVQGLSKILQQSQAGILDVNKAGTANSIAERSAKDGSSLIKINEENVNKGAMLAEQSALAAKALGQIVSSSQKLAAAKQKELDAVEAERKSRLSLVEEFAFGGPQARMDIVENQNLVNRISSGNLSVQQLDPASLQRFGQFLDKLNPNTQLANGQNVGQFKQDLVGQLTVGQFPLLGQPGQFLNQQGFQELNTGTPEEQNLRNEILAAMERAKEAQTALAEAPEKLATKLQTGLGEAVKEFKTSIEDLIRHEQEKFNKQEQAKVQAETAIAGNQNRLRDKASATLGINIKDKESLARAQQAAGLLERLDPINKKGKAFTEFKLQANQIINDKELPEQERQTQLKRLAQDAFPGLNTAAFGASEVVRGRQGRNGFQALSAEQRVGGLESAITAAGGSVGLSVTDRREKQKIEQDLLGLGVATERIPTATAGLTTLNKELQELSTVDFAAINNVAQAIKSTTNILTGIGNFFGGKPQEKASGGLISGPNIRRDIMPALLTPGEFVMRKDAVDRIGVGALSAMNSGAIAGFAKGGLVDPAEFKRRLLEQKAQRDAAKAATDKLVSDRQQASAQAQKAAGEQAKAQVNASQKAAKANFDAQQKANQTKVDYQRQGLAATNQQSAGLMDAFRASGTHVGGGSTDKGKKITRLRALGILPKISAQRLSPSLPSLPSASITPTAQPTSSVSGAAPIVAATKTNQASNQRRGVTPGPSGNNPAALEKAVASFDSVVNKLAETLGNLKNIQHEHTINGRVEVIINSPDFGALGEAMQKMIMDKVSSGINSWAKKNFGAEKVDNINFGNAGKEKK